MIRSFSLDVLGRKIAFSTLVQYAGKVLQLVLAAFSIKLVSNFLSQSGYGVYAAITEYALFFSTVANLGIFGNVVRIMADRPKDGSVFINALALRILTAGIFFALAMIITMVNGSTPAFIFGTALFCGSLFFDYVTSVCDGMLQANYMMGRATFALITGKIVSLGLIFLVLRNFYEYPDTEGMFLVFAAVLLGSLVTAGLSLFFVSKKVEWSWNMNWPMMLKILETSIPFGIINILNSLYFRFLPDFFSHRILDDAHFASFSLSFRIAQVLSLASTFLMFSALPGLSEYIEMGQREKAFRLYRKIKILLRGAGILLVVAGSLVGPAVLTMLTHAKYNLPEFWFVLPAMLVLAAVSYEYDLVLLTLFAAGEDLWFMKREFFALVVAGVFFGAQLLVPDVNIKMALILLGAICGELFMVLAGTQRVRKAVFGSR